MADLIMEMQITKDKIIQCEKRKVIDLKQVEIFKANPEFFEAVPSNSTSQVKPRETLKEKAKKKLNKSSKNFVLPVKE